MDHFGIGVPLNVAAQMYFRSAQRSGRTSSLIDGLQDGDRVCFRSSSEASEFCKKIAPFGKHVECICVPINDPWSLIQRPRSTGRTFFDHDWLESFYLQSIRRLQDEIDKLQMQSSGTKRFKKNQQCCDEVDKWRF